MSEKSSGGSTTIVIRVVVFGALAVLLVLAFLDYQAKNAKTRSFEKLSDAISEREQLLVSEVDNMLEGNPSVEGDPATDSEVIYTWKVLRSYKMRLLVGSNGTDRVVDDLIDGG